MAKESIANSAIVDALKKLKDEEIELASKLKPVQEAIAALEKIVDKTIKKTKPSNAKDVAGENGVEEIAQESGAEV